ncbi:MAG: response regulator transcription factor [Catalinimonas sp.]
MPSVPDEVVTLCLADDHAILAEGLREVLEDTGRFRVLGVAADGAQMLELVSRRRPRVVIVDLQMPRMGGVVCVRKLRRAHPNLKILVLTMHTEAQRRGEARAAGADAYLSKDQGSAALIGAIDAVMVGEPWPLDGPPSGVPKAPPSLSVMTKREAEVAHLLVEGRDNAAIAQQLFLSEKTVKTHRKNIFRKLKINSLVTLVRRAASERWL